MWSDDNFFATLNGKKFWEPCDYITGFIVNQLHLEVGIARNDAIRENTFALFVGMCIRTTNFIVGKPEHIEVPVPVAGPAHRHDAQAQTPVLGTVSRRAQKGVPMRSVGHAPKTSCARQSRSDGCSRSSRSFFLFFEKHVGVLVLEEVGVTALSPHNPLMSLHSLLNRGVEVDGQFVHLCIIGISKGAWIKRIPSGIVFRVSDTCRLSSTWQVNQRGQQSRRQEKDPY